MKRIPFVGVDSAPHRPEYRRALPQEEGAYTCTPTLSVFLLPAGLCTRTYAETGDSIDVGKSRSIEAPILCWKSEEPAPLSLRVARRWGNYLLHPHATLTPSVPRTGVSSFLPIKAPDWTSPSRDLLAEDRNGNKEVPRALSPHAHHHGLALPAEISRAIDAPVFVMPAGERWPFYADTTLGRPRAGIAWRFLLCMYVAVITAAIQRRLSEMRGRVIRCW